MSRLIRSHLGALALFAVLGLLVASPSAAADVTFDWGCEAGMCFFDSSDSTSANRAHSVWDFGDGNGTSTGSFTVDHDYEIGVGEYYFTVNLYAFYYSDPNSPYEVTCEIFTYHTQVGGEVPTQGTCD